ncbi:hypothetical protein [Anaerofustis stercorihominis]|uniref:hypothetical protein n=1 Tax=Anaerofustis stercorihominis TaxID=214853 RepID=UPI001106529D|nr:hypothetical protein [Anaerofustis stercorihominis]
MLKKKIFSVLVAMLMVMAMLPSGVFAATNVSTQDELIDAVEKGGEVVLSNNITLYKSLKIDNNVTLDLNGYTLTYDAIKDTEDAGLIDIYGSADVTIKGNGTITYNSDENSGYMNSNYSLGYAIRVDGNSKVVLEDNVYHAGLTCVQAGSDSSVIINGGTFKADVMYSGTYWHLNLIDNSNASITVKGGTFENFDPSNSLTENPTKNFLAEDAISFKDGNTYNVYKLQHFPAKVANCTQDGNKEYWYIEALDKYFLDKNCTKETTKSDVTIPATGHNYIDGVCSICNEKIQIESPSIDTSKPSQNMQIGIDKNDTNIVLDTISDIVNKIENGDSDKITSIDKDTVKKLESAISDGADISVEVVVDDKINATAEEKELVESTLDEKDLIGQYFDLSIVIKADNEIIGKINNLNKSADFNIVIPQDLLKEGREFFIVRIHDGVAEKLDSVTKDDVITFSTSKFSTYALGYNDKSVSSNTGSVDDNLNETTNTTLNPQTSDNNQLFLWSAILCSASVCILGLLVYVKRKIK